MMQIIPNLMTFITVLNGLLILIVVFAQRRNTAATWAWAVACGLFPIVGFFFYMILGQDSRKERVFMQKTMDDESLLTTYTKMGALEGDYTDNNEIELFHDGRIKFDELINDIKSAKSFVFVQYYILRGDETGQRLMAALSERAAAGVDARLLIDGMGCHALKDDFYTEFFRAGGKLGKFLPPVPVRINFRNHRKLVLIDGEMAYIGGSNIGDEYMGITKRFGHWRDTHMRIKGGSVAPMTLRFMMDWNFASTNKLYPKQEYFPENVCAASTSPHNPHYIAWPPGGTYRPQEPVVRPGARVRIVSSGPDTRYPDVLHGFCRMIMDAKKTVYIQTPYFVPDEALFTAIRIAALSGVDVRIMYPAHPDHPFVYWAGLSYIGELLCVGVRGFEYTKGFIHSKTIMIDSQYCAVGSANMDVRSFKINFETHAFIEDAATTKELEGAFVKDMEDSRAWDLATYNRRPRGTKIKESISRLFSPLL